MKNKTIEGATQRPPNAVPAEQFPTDQFALVDEREKPFVYVDVELDDAGLDPFEFRIYVRIARRCGGTTDGTCWESLNSMAKATDISVSQIKRALNVLEKRKFIKRRSGKTDGISNRLALLDKRHWIALSVGGSSDRTTLEMGGGSSDRARGWVCQTQGLALSDPGGRSDRATKKIHEVNKQLEPEKRGEDLEFTNGKNPKASPLFLAELIEDDKPENVLAEVLVFSPQLTQVEFDRIDPLADPEKTCGQGPVENGIASSAPEVTHLPVIDGVNAVFDSFAPGAIEDPPMRELVIELCGVMEPLTIQDDRILNDVVMKLTHPANRVSAKELREFAATKSCKLNFLAADFGAWRASKQQINSLNGTEVTNGRPKTKNQLALEWTLELAERVGGQG